jgi:hypothetical protein
MTFISGEFAALLLGPEQVEADDGIEQPQPDLGSVENIIGDPKPGDESGQKDADDPNE